jgi:hypothetical protein
MPGSILAAATSDNAPGGAVLTFAFPVILFAVIAVILYLLLSRPHPRIPSRRVVVAPGGAVSAVATTTGSVSGEPAEADSRRPEQDTSEGSRPTEGTEASE